MFKKVIICLMDLWSSLGRFLVIISTHHFIYSCNKCFLLVFYGPSWVLGNGCMLMNKPVIWKPFKKVEFLTRYSEKYTRYYCPAREQFCSAVFTYFSKGVPTAFPLKARRNKFPCADPSPEVPPARGGRSGRGSGFWNNSAHLSPS